MGSKETFISSKVKFENYNSALTMYQIPPEDSVAALH